ncbi:AaceriAER385Cp [[Ashbya] aceris (nom. inval.)]|nr:AaceriAER385Cp [[Ashbya] aceris (nom. inval.)]
MQMSSSLLEAEMFLASLNSEESDNDSYNLFNTPTGRGVQVPLGLEAGLPSNLTPESFQSNTGFDTGLGEGLGSTDFSSPLEPGDRELQSACRERLLVDAGNEAGFLGLEDHEGLSSVSPSAINGKVALGAGSAADSTSSGPGGSAGATHGHGRISKPKRERMSHNIIEKKYRTNINDKILQLREIVPALRVASKREDGVTVGEDDIKQLDGLEPARKLNKASILTKTIEYIKHLEEKCAFFQAENERLKHGQGISTPESIRYLSQNTAFTGVPSSTQNNLSSDASSATSPYTANAYPNSNASGDFNSKFLLGGVALTMGMTCFGENDDFQNARGLFAMPVFHYSPATNGYTLSDTYGTAINIKSSVISLFRLVFFFFVIFRFLVLFLHSNSPKQKSEQDSTPAMIIKFSEALEFGTPSGLWNTLKKTLFVNRFKYPKNCIERVESEIAKCFVLQIYARKSQCTMYLLHRYCMSSWAKLSKQVAIANAVAAKRGQIYGTEWEIITNILQSSLKQTIESPETLDMLEKSGTVAYSMRDFITVVNDSIIKSNTHSILASLLEALVDPSVDLHDTVKRIHKVEIQDDKSLQFARENYIVLNALFNISEVTSKNLLNLLRLEDKPAIDTINKDHLFVLYSAIMIQLLSKGQYSLLYSWFKRVPLKYLDINNCTLLGVTGMYLTLRHAMTHEQDLPEQEIFLLLEELATKLRVWLGSAPADVLDIEVRGKLIEYCMNTALHCGGKIEHPISASSMPDLDEDESEISDSE